MKIGNWENIVSLNRQYEFSNTSIPEISVIIPVYNGETTVRSTLEALMRSTGVAFEVIFVDDCSTDRSREIISEYPFTLISLQKKIGGALARNSGAEMSRAPILFHTDADVEIAPDTLKRVVEEFRKNPELDALFGSYSVICPHKNFWSQYKNLHHHFIHQISRRITSSFWSGCGAVRKKAFFSVGGFSNYKFLYDIDLGYRLAEAGYKTEIISDIQVQHHKYYDFIKLVRSDFFGRAIPWVGLMWTHRLLQNDLNTRNAFKLSVFLVYLSIIGLFLPVAWAMRIALFFIGLLSVSIINLSWWGFCFRQKGMFFAVKAMLMEWLYFFYCGLGVVWGTISYFYEVFVKRRRPGKFTNIK